MNKRYQVFVSSTYDDLKEERSKVVQALLNINCIPCGMEYFPASDEDAWNCIERLIPECDYYVVIIAGKYGSIPEGQQKSYTQMEYELAVAKKVPVLGLLHKNPTKLARERCESQVTRQRKLDTFRKQVGRKLCRYWETSDQLPGELLASLPNQFSRFPRTGWVRGDSIADDEAKTQIIELQRKLDGHAKQLEDYRERERKEESDLASGSDEFIVVGRLSVGHGRRKNRVLQDVTVNGTTTWDELIRLIRRELGIRWDRSDLEGVLLQSLSPDVAQKFPDDVTDELEIDEQCLRAIEVQLNALRLITRRTSGWEFSARGLEYGSRLLALKKGQQSQLSEKPFRLEFNLSPPRPAPRIYSLSDFVPRNSSLTDE